MKLGCSIFMNRSYFVVASLTFFLATCSGVLAQEKEAKDAVFALTSKQGDPDPFASDGDDPFEAARRGEGNVDKKTASAYLRFEIFEMPALTSMTLLDAEFEGKILRARVLELAKKKEATVVSMHAVRFEVGTSVNVESLTEQIYPTEYEPPEALPRDSPLHQSEELLSPTQKQQKVALTFASPSAFDTKNTGITLKADVATVTAEKDYWDVALSYTEVSHLKDREWV